MSITRTKAKLQRGFTLIELLVVIGILAILLAITLIAINPNKHFQDSRNTQRSSNVSEILNAIYEYESANNGSKPAAVTGLTLTMPLGEATALTASAEDATGAPDEVFTVTGNTIASGANVLVTGCSDAASNGTYPVTASTPTSLTVTNGSAVDGSTGCQVTSAIDLCSSLAPTYIADLPTDPNAAAPTGGATPCASGTTAYDTGYTITQTSGRFTVAAPSAEGNPAPTISVTR